MIIRLLITLFCVSFLCGDVFAEGESEIKKGNFPFMAFIYYPDEAIIETTGLRFLRGAVLVKPEWLITSSVGPVRINDTPIGFPRKTLLARLGSVSIDANFTLSEDEDEQEREVIQIVRPYNYSEAQWWRNDITLLKTLLPFNLTSAVSTATIRSKPGIISNSNCFILVYAVIKKFGNWTEERALTRMFVELQSPTQESCGKHFYEETMLCAIDSDETKSAVDSEFCQGNSGGPLICENEVTGLQTYIENNCKSPYLYQLLSAWDNFITCGIENKCSEEHCGNMCMLISKDDPVTKEIQSQTVSMEGHGVQFVSQDITKQTEEITIRTYLTPEVITEELYVPTRVSTLTPALKQSYTIDTTTSSVQTSNMPTTTELTATVPITTTVEPTTEPTPTTETLRLVDMETSWPKDKFPERTKKYENDEIYIERKANVEAQKHDLDAQPIPHVNKPKKMKNAADRIISVPISLIIQFVLAYLII